MKWLSPEDEKKLGFVRDEDKEADNKEPSSPNAEEVRAESKEVTPMEISAKVPKEEEEPNTANPIPEGDLNAEAETERRRRKFKVQRQSSPETPTDKPQARKKTKMTKKGMIDLSDEEPQEAKKEEKTIFAEGTLQALETNIIDNFRKSMTYGEEVVVPIP
ncbi:hypothetical protein R1flu_005360 [Riccia fluitans]|uniref:Uncharacterized protein n=1 Tax=Riccia fluitans TaxID=41844 RepID=A0ABD1YSY7_9MARC